jgi:glycine/D-amino acid oxidase-like deaminating enzyme
MSRPDVVVIGGGIVGTAAAASLADAGARVTLYEREWLAAAASGRNSGVVQQPFDPVLARLYHASLDRYRDLESDPGGPRLGPEPAGLLLVTPDPSVAEAAARSVRAAGAGLEPEILDPAAVRRLEPSLAPDVAACRVPIGYPVPPAVATRAFGTNAARNGVEIREGVEATPIVERGRAVGVRLADGSTRAADAVLVAAGPWTPDVVDPTGRWRPIRSVWGVVVDARLADPPRHVLEEAEIEGVTDAGTADVGGTDATTPEDAARALDEMGRVDVAFSLVTAAGTSAVGSTFMEDAADPATLVGPIVRRAAGFVPSVAGAEVGPVRMCARPVSLDGRPLIGELPWIDGLWIAAGNGPWGISTGPATAAIVADAILGRGTAIPPELDAARFGAPA